MNSLHNVSVKQDVQTVSRKPWRENRRTDSHILRMLVLAIGIVLCTAVWGQRRSADDALSIARQHLQSRSARTDGRRMAPAAERPSVLTSRQILHASGQWMEGNEAADAFYVLNYSKSGCFVIVAADERMGSVLAYSDNQAIAEPAQMAPALLALLQGYAAQAKDLDTKPIQIGQSKKREPVADVPYMIQTQWSQRAPYNLLCPTIESIPTVTGCVATMMSQLMYYYRQPTVCAGSISYTTESSNIDVNVDLNGYTPDWDHMLPTYKNGYDETEALAVSQLMQACGATVMMDYGTGESSASVQAVPFALTTFFGYDRDIVAATANQMTESDFHNLLQAELADGRPVACGGNNERGAGHAFIIDGMKGDGDDEPFYHINLGWEGLNDGYFKFPELEYNLSNCIILYCQPENDKDDCGAFLQAEAVTPTLRKINLSKIHEMAIEIQGLSNSKIGSFNGTLMAFVVDTEGHEVPVGSQNIEIKAATDYRFRIMRSVRINAAIPDTLPTGEYRVIVKAQEQESNNEATIVYAAETRTFIITDEDVSLTPTLEVTDMRINKQACSETIVSVSMIEMANFGSVAFKGDIALAITNDDSIVCMLDPMYTYTTELRSMSINQIPFTVEGCLTGSIEDGDYRIVALARQADFDNWGVIKKYAHVNYTISSRGQDLYIPVRIENRCISIDESELPTTYPAKLMISELNVNTEESKSNKVSININQPVNIDSQPFTGTFSMAVIDADNKVLEVFGDSVAANDLTPYAFVLYASNITFKGKIPSTLADGEYRVCIAAQYQGYSNWTPLTSYTIEDNTVTMSQNILTLGFKITKGKAHLDTDTEEYEPQDVNQDGTIDTQDVLAIYNFIQEDTGNAPETEDVNQDGAVDTQDVLFIYDYIQNH